MVNGKPKPFSRPSIDLGSGPKKEWQEVEVQALQPGDTVRGFGAVVKIDTDESLVTSIDWANGRTSIFDARDVVTAFTAI
jgi:hypothetical protein